MILQAVPEWFHPGNILAGLGAIAAGLGIYRFGASRGSAQIKFVAAMDLFMKTQDQIATAQERQAAALEANARLILLLEAWHSQQEQTSLTLRVLSREVHEVKELIAPFDSSTFSTSSTDEELKKLKS